MDVKVAQRSTHEQSKISPCPTDARTRAEELYRKENGSYLSHVMVTEGEE